MAKKSIKKISLEIAEKYLSILRKNKIKLMKVYLFGSFAKGISRKDSDIDIAIVSDNFTGDWINDRLILMRLRREVDLSIEPHPFLPEEFDKTNPFVNEIIRTGIRIK